MILTKDTSKKELMTPGRCNKQAKRQPGVFNITGSHGYVLTHIPFLNFGLDNGLNN